MSAADRARLVGDPDPYGCADEPIHIPGSIQPHGVLLAVREPDLTVAVVSENAGQLLDGGPEQLLGRRLDDVLAPGAAAELRELLGSNLAEVSPWTTQVASANGPRWVDVTLHRSDGLLIVELEAGEESDTLHRWYGELRATLRRLQHAPTVDALWEVLAREVRAHTGFDRVMVYRFDRDWNGEVVAEDRQTDLDPFLGLWYPSTDIPAQARALYVQNWLRLIPDAGYRPAPLLAAEPGNAPLDLSGSTLRSVSPVHVEYLKNMGVVASMSVSLLAGGRLWGLVACHHYAGPHRPSPRVREAAAFIGQTASLLLPAKDTALAYERALAVSAALSELQQAVAASGREPVAALQDRAEVVLELLQAGGAALRMGGETRLVGETPSDDQVRRIAAVLWPRGGAEPGVTAQPVPPPVTIESLAARDPQWAAIKDVASGVLGVPLGGRRDQYLLWFRPEVPREVSWGGDPTSNKLVATPEGTRLSPRRSFAKWTEQVSLRALPWEQHDVDAAVALASALSERVLRHADQQDELAAALQRAVLLEDLPEVPGVAVAARYLASDAGPVGGDWYDLVYLPNGHVALVVGDVAGHGLPVAAVTAQLRHALRAYLLKEPGPGTALARLNELAHWALPDELATVIVVDLDPASSQARVVTAGHLPLLIVDDSGARYLDGGRGPGLGLVEDARYPEAVVDLAAGSLVLLYSDGLIERREEGIDAGLERLRLTAASLDWDLEQLCDRLLDELDGRSGADDVTLLAGRTVGQAARTDPAPIAADG